MSKEYDLARILNNRIIAVLPTHHDARLIDLAESLAEAGIEVLAVHCAGPRPHRALERLADHAGDRLLLGAAGVLDSETARVALLSGARFITSSAFCPDVAKLCRRYDGAVIPGAATPTEIVRAWEGGADLINRFPSDVGGPEYLRMLRQELPHVRFMASGAVNLLSAADYLRAGAAVIAVGGALVEPAAVEAGDWDRVEALARQYVEIVRETR